MDIDTLMKVFNIDPNEKFALVFASGLRKSDEFNVPLQLNNNIWYFPRVPVQNISAWKE